MENYNNEEAMQCADLKNNWPMNAADENQDDKNEVDPDEEDDDDNEEGGLDDWGDIDPAGGDAPSAPGSAV